jgi:hypothetical protein
MGAIWCMHALIHVLSGLMNKAMHITDQKILFLKKLTALMMNIAVYNAPPFRTIIESDIKQIVITVIIFV